MNDWLFLTYDSVKFDESQDTSEDIFKKVLISYKVFKRQLWKAKLITFLVMTCLISFNIFMGNKFESFISTLFYFFATATLIGYWSRLSYYFALENSFDLYLKNFFDYTVYREAASYLINKYSTKDNLALHLVNLSKLELYHHRCLKKDKMEEGERNNEKLVNECFKKYNRDNTNL